jgi:hypothetical protein
MLDMASNPEHSINIQGLLIHRRIDALRDRIKNHTGNGVANPKPVEDNSDVQPGFGLDMQLDEMSAIDMFWDFPILTSGFGSGFN